MSETVDCETCQTCSEVTSDLKEHLKKKHIKQEPEYEISFLADESGGITTELAGKVQKFQCKVCLEGFSKRSDLKTHSFDHRAKRYSCDYCGRKFFHKQSLAIHFLIHENKKPFNCNICQKKFRHKGTLTLHSYLHSGVRPFLCIECTKSFVTRNQLKVHVNNVHKMARFECKICGKFYMSQTYLGTHVKVVHLKLSLFKCDLCSQTFRSKVGLRNHKCSTQQASSGLFKCECGKAFICQSSLRKHQQIHSTLNVVSPFKCELCGTYVLNKASLTSHARIHLPVQLRPFQCELCKRRFYNNHQLKTHTMTVHEKLKLYHCLKCDGSFDKKVNVQHHMCPGEDSNSDKLERVVIFKGPSNEINQYTLKLLQCHECGKLFRWKHSLTLHAKSHKERPEPVIYKCIICQRPYKLMTYLKKHMETMHSNKPPETKTEENRLHCELCSVSFTTMGNLMLHRRLHGKSVQEAYRPVRCEFCNEGFYTKVALGKHKCCVNKDKFIIVNVVTN